MEQATDQRLDPSQGPPLVRPAMDERPSLQLSLQPGDLRIAEPRSARGSFRQDPGPATLAPLATPPFHGPLADPQRGSDLPVLLPALEAFHGLQPDPLSGGPPGLGQPAALRVSHSPGLPERAHHRQANGSDITHSSSVARGPRGCPRPTVGSHNTDRYLTLCQQSGQCVGLVLGQGDGGQAAGAGYGDVPDAQHLVGGRVRGGPALHASGIGQ